MIFLSNLLQDRPSVGITNLLSNITTKPDSHKGGWARLLKCQLENINIQAKILTNSDSLEDFDVIIFDLGAEFSGSLNMFGGLDEKVFKRLQQIEAYQGRLFSWKHELPSLGSLAGRRSNESTCESYKQTDSGFLGRVQEKLNQAGRFDHVYKTKSLLIGDSHTPGVWDPSFMIERQDGRTLYGSLQNKTISKIVKEHDGIEKVKIHMSSIDLRHHICRQEDPEGSISKMLDQLGDELNDLRNQGMLKRVSLNHTMGIEDESRELPKTGYYKGTPFFGDWKRRSDLRKFFNSKLDEVCYRFENPGGNDFVVSEYPEYFLDKSGKLRFDVMERPQSVHISPAHYKWDLDKNELRWTQLHQVKMAAHFATLGLLGRIEKDMYGS